MSTFRRSETHATIGEGFAELSGPAAREAREKFCEMLESDAACEALDRLVELSESGTVALLCFEHDETRVPP